MPTFAQYNPSTGKVSYTASSGKQQVLNVPIIPCRTCTDTPFQLKVTFDGITTNNYQCQDVFGRDWEWDGLPDFNGEYILNQIPDRECYWDATVPFDSSGFKRFYNSTNGSCSGGVYASIELVGLYIRVHAVGFSGDYTVVTDLVKVMSTPPVVAGEPWFSLAALVVPTDCVNFQDEPSVYTPPTIQPGYGGSVTVEDI